MLRSLAERQHPQAGQLGAREGLRLPQESVAARLGSLNDVVRWQAEQWAGASGRG